MAKISAIPEISIEGFQVVRGEMFVHQPKKSDPTCTLWKNSISFNKMAIQILNNCERIRIEVNSKTKGLLVVPVTIQDKDGIRWLKGKQDISARKIECRAFTSQLFETWEFDFEQVYRATGKLVTADKKVMLLFDFKEAESWTFKAKNKVKRND